MSDCTSDTTEDSGLMNDRDKLASLIDDEITRQVKAHAIYISHGPEADEIADAILAEGWRPPVPPNNIRKVDVQMNADRDPHITIEFEGGRRLSGELRDGIESIVAPANPYLPSGAAASGGDNYDGGFSEDSYFQHAMDKD